MRVQEPLRYSDPCRRSNRDFCSNLSIASRLIKATVVTQANCFKISDKHSDKRDGSTSQRKENLGGQDLSTQTLLR